MIDLSSFKQKETRVGAIAYCRVSDPSQAERKNSIAQQRRIIEEHFVHRLGMEILGWYIDEGKSALRDEEAREQFWAMIERAKTDPRVKYIVVDEESRFFRNKYKTAAVKGDLLDHGIRCMTATRHVDPLTVAGAWQESIEETAAYTHSLQNRHYTLRGMAGNIHQRDPETGWAFKNGPPPYGWKAKRLHLGNDSRGRPISRTIWLLDDEKAAVRRQILLWRKEGWTYEQIRDELNRRRIPAPRSELWSSSTIVSMCREDMVWTAAGYSIWNKHHRKQPVKGEKFKPLDDWEIEPNGHPAIISEEDARAIIELGRSRRRAHDRGRRRQRQSPYLLSGDNLYGVPLFICGACGSRMVGLNPGGRNRRKYICSTKVNKGAQYCESDRVDCGRLEQAVLDVLKQRITKDYILAVIAEANMQIEQANSKPKPVDLRVRRLADIERQLQRIRESILAGIDPSMWTEETKKLQAEQKDIEASLKADPPSADSEQTLQPIPEDRAIEIARRLSDGLNSADIERRREVLTKFVRQITLSPRKKAVYLELHPNPLDLSAPSLFAMSGESLVPPTGFEPVLPP